MASKLFSLRRTLSALLKPHFPYSSSLIFLRSRALLLEASSHFHLHSTTHSSPPSTLSSRSFFASRSLDLDADSQGPAAIDYRYGSLLQEDEFHSLADCTIHDLQEKFEEYGDSVQIDGFDIDYGVLTLKLGDLGTYVLNKQTPNRQLWLSSPVSGPSRFDWDKNAQTWIYRQTKANLLEVFESELQQLCGETIKLA